MSSTQQLEEHGNQMQEQEAQLIEQIQELVNQVQEQEQESQLIEQVQEMVNQIQEQENQVKEQESQLMEQVQELVNQVQEQENQVQEQEQESQIIEQVQELVNQVHEQENQAKEQERELIEQVKELVNQVLEKELRELESQVQTQENQVQEQVNQAQEQVNQVREHENHMPEQMQEQFYFYNQGRYPVYPGIWGSYNKGAYADIYNPYYNVPYINPHPLAYNNPKTFAYPDPLLFYQQEIENDPELSTFSAAELALCNQAPQTGPQGQLGTSIHNQAASTSRQQQPEPSAAPQETVIVPPVRRLSLGIRANSQVPAAPTTQVKSAEERARERTIKSLRPRIVDDSPEGAQKMALFAKRFEDSLVHASRCDASDCSRMTCWKLKQIIMHYKPANCIVCKELYVLVSLHAKACRVPFCVRVRCNMFDNLMEERLKKLAVKSQGKALSGAPGEEMLAYKWKSLKEHYNYKQWEIPQQAQQKKVRKDATQMNQMGDQDQQQMDVEPQNEQPSTSHQERRQPEIPIKDTILINGLQKKPEPDNYWHQLLMRSMISLPHRDQNLLRSLPEAFKEFRSE